jgi:OOP family OmpA-OmpF porin
MIKNVMRLPYLVGASIALLEVLGGGAEARADDSFRLHAEAGLAHAIGAPQSSEFGFGGGGALAGELAIGRLLGIQLELSALGLAQGSPPPVAHVAAPSAAAEFGGMLGLRFRPMGATRVAGLWIDANGGAAYTGDVVRATFDAHVGYDFRLGQTGRWDLGPFVGYTQVFEPSDTVVPGDAHILWVGVHAALGASRGDRDHDGIYDDEDACPDVPGIRTNDPKTNGCPRGDRDHDGVFDDEDACPDVPGIRTNDPKTNGCPRSDRDNDTVYDDEDACPDVPGVRTNDPKTNGCPPAGDKVRLEGETIVLDDILHFDLDSPRVRRESMPILRKLAEFMNANPDIIEIDIEGHADETGTEAHNMELSRMRAYSVKQALKEFGVDPKRMTTHSYGESRPRVQGHAEESLRQNRRVEFTVTRSRAKPQELSPQSPGAASPAPPPAPVPGGSR